MGLMKFNQGNVVVHLAKGVSETTDFYRERGYYNVASCNASPGPKCHYNNDSN
jgi:hypothetical protein